MKHIIPLFLFFTTAACGQNELSLVNKESGLRLTVIDEKFPLLKILIPGQAAGERGTGNVWTNPERTCHHVDPVMTVRPGEAG